MRRNQIVEKLINEGFSEKTLVKFSDKQLSDLSERIFGEAITTTADAMSKSASIQNLAKKQDVKLVGEEDIEEDNVPTKKQLKSLDKNKNKKIDSEDFKLLRKEKKGGNVSKKKEKSEVKEWVNSLVNEKYHNFTRKGEIMELIQSKMTNSVSHGPNVKKGHNGIPEFMSYDAIMSNTTTEPITKPVTKPVTKPKKPMSPNPNINPAPSAGIKGQFSEDETITKPVTKPVTKPKKPMSPNPSINPAPSARKK